MPKKKKQVKGKKLSRRKSKASAPKAKSKPRPGTRIDRAIEESDVAIKTSSSTLSGEFESPDQTGNQGRRELSPDTEGLSDDEEADSESVAELVDEGQDLEAEEVEAIQDALEPDQGEVAVHRAPNKTRPRPFKDRNRL